MAGALVTILDGSALRSGSLVTINSGEGPDTVLRGFTLTNGTVGTPFGGDNALVGGALFSENTSPTIEQCVFRDNAAAFGGAVFCRDGAPTFSECSFLDNQATVDGGAIRFSRTNALLEDSDCQRNQAGGNGGAIHATNSVLVVRQTLLSENSSLTGNGGGMNYGSYGGSLLVSNSTFTANTATEGIGGGLHLEDVTILPVLVGNTLCENAPDQLAGGEWTDGGGNTICECPADLNGDGEVDGIDLGMVLGAWGLPCDG